MENKKTHWKKAFKSDYLSSSDIDDKDLQLTISHVIYQECTTQTGKKYCNVAYFKESSYKPMILNVTNSKVVKKFSGNKTHLEDWKNIPVTIYVDNNVRFAGDTVEGLRIRPTQFKKPVKLTPLIEDMIPKAIDFLKGGKTIEDLKKFYSFDKNIETKIMSQL